MKLSPISRLAGPRPFVALFVLALSLAMLPGRAEAAPPTLTISAATTHVVVKQGGRASDLVSVQTGGSFSGSVTLSVSGLPSSVAAAWSSHIVAPKNGVAVSTLTLAPSAAASPNWYAFTVTASGDGKAVSTTFAVEVKPSAGLQVSLSAPALSVQNGGHAALKVTAQPLNGVTIPSNAAGATATLVSGLPSGVAASWSKPSVATNGSVSWTLTLAANGAPTGGETVDLKVQIADANGGLTYAAAPSFPLLVSLIATVKIGATPGFKIPANFMGLSHEWNEAQDLFMGSSQTGVNTVYRQLLGNLASFGSAPINIRIGGESTDSTGQPTATTAVPFEELAQATGSHFSLGVNLGADDPSLAAAQAKAYMAQMPDGYLDALEIGNEPDLYFQNGKRPSTYTVEDYYNDFNTWRSAISPALRGNTKLMGASWGYYTTLQANASTYEGLDAGSLSTYSQHAYVASPANKPTAEFMLSPAASDTVPAAVAAAVALTHSHGLPFRMGEFNSISDGGAPGVSDSFAAALWALDVSFEFANVGVDGMNWLTTAQDADSPFDFNVAYPGGPVQYSLSAIRPLYYSLYLFQMALGGGADMLPVALSTPANLKAWATEPTGRTPRVTIINKDLHQSGNVQVAMPGYNHAQIVRLTAPSYLATHAVSLAGQTFDGTKTGVLRGAKTVETLDGDNGVFQVPMAVASAALVIFQK